MSEPEERNVQINRLDKKLKAYGFATWMHWVPETFTIRLAIRLKESSVRIDEARVLHLTDEQIDGWAANLAVALSPLRLPAPTLEGETKP